MDTLDRTKLRLVYQSGHTNTWCDGKQHVETDGGWCHDHIPFDKSWTRREPHRCTCELWGNPK